MRIGKYEVPEAVESACIARMKAGEFRAYIIAEAAVSVGCDASGQIAARVADRLIQRERRKHNIRTTRYPNWEWKP